MKRIFFILFFVLSLFNSVLAFNWKVLHEKADNLALAQALKNVELKPESIDELYVLGLVYLNLYKDKEAKQIFDKVSLIDSNSTEAIWAQAELLRRRHELDKSEEILNRVIKINPDFAPAYISMAYIKYIKMDFEASVKLALKVMEQGRDKVDITNYVRAYCLYAGGKGMIAHYGGPLSKIINGTVVLSTLKKAQELQPNSAAVMLGLGSFYLLAPALAGGDIQKAQEYLEEAVSVDPLMADAYVRLAQAYQIQGDNNKYNLYLDKALSIDPLNEVALDIKNNNCKFICVK